MSPPYNLGPFVLSPQPTYPLLSLLSSDLGFFAGIHLVYISCLSVYCFLPAVSPVICQSVIPHRLHDGSRGPVMREPAL